MHEWNENFKSKATINGKDIFIGQQDFSNGTIAIKDENNNIINCPMKIDENGDFYLIYDNYGVYLYDCLIPFPVHGYIPV